MAIELAYAFIALSLLAIGVATTPRSRSYPIITVAALLWPLMLAAIAMHVAYAKMSARGSSPRYSLGENTVLSR